MDTLAHAVSEVIAVESALMAVLAVLFLAIGWRRDERGFFVLSAGFALMATWYLGSEPVEYHEPWMDTPAQRLAGVGVALAVLVVTAGVARYLGPVGPRMRLLLLLCWTPGAALALVLLAGVDVAHRLFHVGVLASYVGVAVLALKRSLESPGQGHAMLGAALAGMPMLPLVMAWLSVPTQWLKPIAGWAVVVFGILVMLVALLRRQQLLQLEVQRRSAAEEALRQLNNDLEAKVRLRTEHLHELVEGLETFTRSVSHDLSGPLGAMSQLATLAETALAEGNQAPARAALPVIARQCDASTRLVRTLLSLARVGTVQARRQEVDLAALTQEACDEVLLSWTGRRPELHLHHLPRLQSDPALLRPVLVNLIGNAVKFSDCSHPARVSVQACAVGRDLLLCVEDNGEGIDPAVAQRMFEPFVKGGDRGTAGHGLGLSIVRRAVMALEGQVWAEPCATGARLCVRLPDALTPTQAASSLSGAALHG
jgi:signal transduction histidine kinase